MAPENGGRYRLDRLLDPEGNSWIAEDLEEPDRAVVVKMLPEASDVIAARHVVDALSDLRIPELSVPTDHGETADGRQFLVYPWVEGLTLRELLNTSGPLSLARAGEILRQIATAVTSLHERGMVHAAVAPDHIIVHHVHGHDKVTVLNGGAFRVTGVSTVSPAYLAPEQLSGAPTQSSDIFSAAAVTAEMLTGRRAFRYGSLSDLEHLQKRGIPRGSLRKMRSKIPVRVEDELRRALSWDPGQRPPDMEALSQRVGEYLRGARALPTRRLLLLGGLGLAFIATRIRACRQRWGR